MVLLWSCFNKYWVLEICNKNGFKYSLENSWRFAPIRKETAIMALNIPMPWVGQLWELVGLPIWAGVWVVGCCTLWSYNIIALVAIKGGPVPHPTPNNLCCPGSHLYTLLCWYLGDTMLPWLTAGTVRPCNPLLSFSCVSLDRSLTLFNFFIWKMTWE